MLLLTTLLIPTLPLTGFLILVLAQKHLNDRLSAWVGIGSVLLSALLVGGLAYHYFNQSSEPIRLQFWTWMSVSGFNAEFGFYLDALALTMMLIITGIGSLIHIYSAGYMRGDEGFSRFFAYMNLFIAAMLILVMADNLVLLFLGWEGVGLCSYLLIGFWYKKPENGYAARKAFIVTRIGDTAMMLGLFFLYRELGFLDIQAMLERAAELWPAGSDPAFWAALLLLGGAVGKSAQLPLQTWLPDAMAGPTPISALIHAATMVTAGVYLIARTHVLFILAPDVQQLVSLIGALTLLMSACTALTQHDIKRVLAYSTMSQIGYMFLALGVGAWSAAIFHLMTHAFFKALLFLGAGAVILALHHQQDLRRMGGLWRAMPSTFILFLIGACALVALPFTSGYFSKHEILAAAYQSHIGFWMAAVIGAFLTAVYTSRLIFLAFFGAQQSQAQERRELLIIGPLIALAVLALLGGFLQTPLAPVFAISRPAFETAPNSVAIIETIAPFLGILLAWTLFYRGQRQEHTDEQSTSRLRQFLAGGWGFDRLYGILFLTPYQTLAALNKQDAIDDIYTGISQFSTRLYGLLSQSQNGQLRRYAWVFGLAGSALIAIGLLR